MVPVPPLARVAVWWLAAVSSAVCQDAETGRQVTWQPDLEIAFERATEGPRPVLVCLTDGGPAEERALEEVYGHEDFVALSEELLCLIGCPLEHEEEVLQVGDLTRRVCQRFGPMSCADHQQLVDHVRRRLELEGEMLLPQHVLFMPDGTVLHRRAFPLERDDLLALMRRGLHACGITTPADESEILVPAEKDQKKLIPAKVKEAKKEGFGAAKRRILEEAWDIATPTIRDEMLDYIAGGDNDEVRGVMIGLVAAHGEYTVLDTLLKAAQHRREYVALAAVDGLRTLGLPEATEVLGKLLRKYDRGQPHGRVLHAYAACGIGDEEVLAAVLENARDHDTNTRTYGLLALRYAAPTAEVVELLSAAMADQVTRVRAAAVWAVGVSRMAEGRPALEALLAVERGVDLKAMAQRALTRIDDPDAERDEDDPEAPVRQVAFEALIEDWVPLRDGRF